MSKQHAFEASSSNFDGEAVSRADREFLTRLGDHPLLHNPLYSAPPPPLPDYAALTSAAAVEAAQKACFAAALDWLLVNYAFYGEGWHHLVDRW